MNLIQEVEQFAGTEFTALEADVKKLAAVIWGDAKAVAKSGEDTVITELKAALPVFVTALRSYALKIVSSLENNPAFIGALGSMKWGVAAWQIWSAVSTGALGPAVILGESVLSTLIEDAVQAMKATAVASVTKAA